MSKDTRNCVIVGKLGRTMEFWTGSDWTPLYFQAPLLSEREALLEVKSAVRAAGKHRKVSIVKNCGLRREKTILQANPAPVTTYTDGLIMVGIGAILGGLGYFLYTKSQAASAAANALPEQVQTGVDSSGNPTYSYVAPSGIGVFVNQTPGPLGPSATYNPSAAGA